MELQVALIVEPELDQPVGRLQELVQQQQQGPLPAQESPKYSGNEIRVDDNWKYTILKIMAEHKTVSWDQF